ncbi:hypothetical protein [Gimesia sp.]|uniref:hypothetical protein n=1 Tax=Gimesia sp. TaxID=2024833 RepID=UPI000C3C0D97|nr:hypothetical protein [Gimesia sp.]MAX35938.1 hypothetical protein [Gimesia sp.]HAH45016.1 hypothetical protein [Planctomycetaceae bacterium]HBL44807.1 hypothetical protein [Planctomycetaceae bacterium]|tara:strand:+ start:724 stop:1305 length:582 start_codon:yes stop_codon:yes gene_type:complete
MNEFKPYKLMQSVVDFLERESVPYRIVGSIASIIYGEPRFTNDVDILVDLPESKIELLCHQFSPPDYHVSPDAAREAIAARKQFNIIHLPSGFKADLILTIDTEFGRLDISQGRRISSQGFFNALFASPENVILKKLIFFQGGGSDKHLRDCASILLVQGSEIDQEYLRYWSEKLEVAEELKIVADRVEEKWE